MTAPTEHLQTPDLSWPKGICKVTNGGELLVGERSELRARQLTAPLGSRVEGVRRLSAPQLSSIPTYCPKVMHAGEWLPQPMQPSRLL